MITVLHRGGYAQMITILHGGESLGTPKSDYVICARPLRIVFCNGFIPFPLYHPTLPFQFESIFLQLADRRRAGALSVYRGNCGDDLWLPRE